MSTARLLIGDVFERMAELPDGSVDLVLTSPPFLALRSYLPADHPDKAKEIGSEPTPAAFLDTLLHLTAEWRRVLAPHGSIAIELGDTYSGSGGAGGDYAAGGLRAGQDRFDGSASRAYGSGAAERPSGSGRARPATRDWGRSSNNPSTRSPAPGWPMDKSLCGIPHLYHLSLAYGRNLLTGEPSPAGSWRVRNVVAWCRPNPPVGALGDKFRPGTSYMTIATITRDRYFDLDAVRGAPKSGEPGEVLGKRLPNGPRGVTDGGPMQDHRVSTSPYGAPPLDWWEIPTQPYKGSHYATWPMALCERPIKAMVPQRVCTECGEPSRRIVGEATYDRTDSDRVPPRLAKSNGERVATGVNQHHQSDGANTSVVRNAPTLGWSDCGHESWRNGLVLDPFAGSGTTLASATGHGRDAIGIDLDARNADLARERVGLFLEVETPESAGAA